jgi:hypothetical protein
MTASGQQAIGACLRCFPTGKVEYAPNVDSHQILSFYMGKNTPERKNCFMENPVVPVEE